MLRDLFKQTSSLSIPFILIVLLFFTYTKRIYFIINVILTIIAWVISAITIFLNLKSKIIQIEKDKITIKEKKNKYY